MLLSIKWLREFTPFNGSLDELSDTLTMLGLEVEEQVTPFSHLQDIVVGYVRSCKPHPNADKLSLCEVDIGQTYHVSIICGAPNISQGQFVAVAPIGTTLPNGYKIKKTKIRGTLSEGMICSEQELQLGIDHTGIIVLDKEYPPGTCLIQALDLDETIFDVGITPNRADCLNIRGLAREVATYYNLPLYDPYTSITEKLPDCSSVLEIDIEDPQMCPLYQARIIQNIVVSPSPAWIRYRLMAHGVRPINNVVDITNYVLLELGHPLHAFDQNLLNGNKIRVANAQNGQRFVTLDQQERTLNDQDLLIWDSIKPIALAGIMGGENSEINENSSNVVLECAVFSPSSIRRTTRRLGISSEASYRFERGVDQPGSVQALDRATSLIQKITNGDVLQGVTKQEPKPKTFPIINFRPHRTKKLLAIETDKDFCKNILSNLGCSVDETQSDTWKVTPPSYRLDLEREVDLIEEIGRFYGFEKVPAQLPKISKQLNPQHNRDKSSLEGATYQFIKRVKNWAQGLGFKEVINYSFVGAHELKQLGILNKNNIHIQNPLSFDQDTLRPELVPGLLQNIQYNIDQNHHSLRLFEIAKTFKEDTFSETTAQESTKLGLVLHGSRNPNSWPWTQSNSDYLDLKGSIEHLFKSLNLAPCSFSLKQNHSYLDILVTISCADRNIGIMGLLNSELAKLYHARNPIYIAELYLDTLYQLYNSKSFQFQPWPKFPPVNRDMTIIAQTYLKFSDIEQAIAQSNINYLEEFVLLDVYQPSDSPERNLTFRMHYRHPERTLTDKEVDKKHSELGRFLQQYLPIRFP